jgi:hypothetical protein
MADADVQPKAEPEVSDLERFPRPGSQQWVLRYQRSLEILRMLNDECPSHDPAIRIALGDLAKRMGEDIYGQAERMSSNG